MSALSRFFTITQDPLYPLIRVRVTDFWRTDTVDRYGEALSAAIEARRNRGSRFWVLIDARSCPVQSAEVRDRFAELRLDWAATGTPGPLIITNPTLREDLVASALGGVGMKWSDPALAMSWIDRQLAAMGPGRR